MEEEWVLWFLLLSPSKEVGDSKTQLLPVSQTTRKWVSSPSSCPWNSTSSVSPNEQDTSCWVGGNIIYVKRPSPFPARCYFWFPSSVIKVGEVAAVGRLGEVWAGWVSAGQVPLGKFPWRGGRVTVVSWEINQAWLQDQWIDYNLPMEKLGCY